MSEIKHTPGPWKTDKQGIITGGPDYCTSICTTGRHFYADRSTFGYRWAEQPHIEKMRLEHEANARLIAVAPDLLEVSKAALKEIKGVLSVTFDSVGERPKCKIERQLEAIIARAEKGE